MLYILSIFCKIYESKWKHSSLFFVDVGLFILYSRARSKHAIRSGSDILIHLHVTQDPNNTLQNEVLMSSISKPNYIIEF